MSDLFERIKTLNDDVNYPWMLHVIDTAWYFTSDSIYWSNEEEDQTDPDSWNYGAEYYEGYNKQDGCFFFNYDDGCGNTITAVLKEDKLLDFQDDKNE